MKKLSNGKYWLILLPLFLFFVLACGIMAIPATVDSSTPQATNTEFAQKPPILANSTPSASVSTSCVVLAEKLNLRASPGTDAEADSDGLKRGDKLERIGAVAGWWKVIVEDGREGWVKREFVECE